MRTTNNMERRGKMKSIRAILRQNDEHEIKLNFDVKNRYKSAIVTSIIKAISILILGIIVQSNVGGYAGLFTLLSTIGIGVVMIILGVQVSTTKELLDVLRLILIYFITGVLYIVCFILVISLSIFKVTSDFKWLSLISIINVVVNFCCYYASLFALDIHLQYSNNSDKF